LSGVAVIGSTTWGMTLGVVLASKGIPVRVWVRTPEEASRIESDGAHCSRLTGTKLPFSMSITSSISEAMDDVKAIVLAVPSQTMRQNIKLVAEHLTSSMLIISAAKGLEIESNKRMSQVIGEEIDPAFIPNICVLSGPNLSKEIINNLPAATVIAAESESTARIAQRLFTTPDFCVYLNTDIVGVELGGALKNVIALAAGISDGLGYGNNAKAALITRGLTEISALGVAMGANPLTLSGLAGLGDLIATCASPLSRNHYVGVELTRGRSLEEIVSSMDNVAEGISTTRVTWTLAQEHGIEMPITERIYRVLYQNLAPSEAATELMAAETNHELEGRKWRLFSFFKRKKQVETI